MKKIAQVTTLFAQGRKVPANATKHGNIIFGTKAVGAYIRADARTQDAIVKDTSGQQRVFTTSILNFLNQK